MAGATVTASPGIKSLKKELDWRPRQSLLEGRAAP